MAGTLLYNNSLIFGSATYPWYVDGEYTCVPCVIGDDTENPRVDRKMFRSRPTGESGSGPYFVSYKTSGKDYDGYWYNSTAKYRYLTSLDVVKYDDYGFAGHFYSNGVEAYSCGVGGGAYSHQIFWNYIKRCDNGYIVSTRRCSSGVTASTWSEAESRMREQLPKAANYTGNMIMYIRKAAGCYWREIANDSDFKWELFERDAFEWFDLTGTLPRGYQIAATQSYIEAADSLPVATTNSIANVIQTAGSVVNILKGDFSPKSVKDVWLRYRYEYCTTKMDVEEYTELTRRLLSLANATSVTCTGRFEYKGVSCVTSFDVDQSQWMPDDALSWLKTYGFRFSAVNAWDMVPYSFVADWFLHISDILEAFQNQGDAISLHTSNCWHVFQTEYDSQFTMFRVPKAIRWGIPYVSYKPASGKTIGKRITDAIALFLC